MSLLWRLADKDNLYLRKIGPSRGGQEAGPGPRLDLALEADQQLGDVVPAEHHGGRGLFKFDEYLSEAGEFL